MHQIIHPRMRATLAMVGLLLVILWVYAPTLGFGLMWDDPLWFGRVVGKSFGELVTPRADYQFYRPGLMLYIRLFVFRGQTIAAPLLHAAQIGWHLTNIALVYTLSRRLGLGNWRAVAVAGLTALYPFSYQAVAWAAPVQPMAAALQSGAWLAYLEARPGRAHRHLGAALSLVLFMIALTAQESTVVVSIVPLLMELVLWRPGGSVHSAILIEAKNLAQAGKRPFALLRAVNRTVIAHWKLALVYPLLGLGFGLVWLQIPRLPGYTSLTFGAETILYLLQGFVSPLLGWPPGYGPGQPLATGTLAVLMVLALVGMLMATRLAGRGRLALFGLMWASLGIAPAVVGLHYSYAGLSSRLLYGSGPGVALLWICALLPGWPAHRIWPIAGGVLVGLIAVQSGLLLSGFQRMYAVGTSHLSELVEAAQVGPSRLLFVNFPDRYTPRRPPYPLGYWGLTLAPVSVDLGDFSAVVAGVRPLTESRSLPWIDADARDASPYYTDLRGVITPPDQLYQLAHKMDAVYLSRYATDGTMSLQWAGAAVSQSPQASACQAVFGRRLCLQSAEIAQQPGQARLILTWQGLSEAQEQDTVFVHVGQIGQPPIAQADGDLWMGILPLFVLPPGDTIREQRIVPLPQPMPLGGPAIIVGVYDRLTGERLPATTSQGEPLPENAAVIGHLP